MKSILTLLLMSAVSSAHALSFRDLVFQNLTGSYTGVAYFGASKNKAGICSIQIEDLGPDRKVLKVQVTQGNEVKGTTSEEFQNRPSLISGAGAFGIHFQIKGFDLYGILDDSFNLKDVRFTDGVVYSCSDLSRP